MGQTIINNMGININDPAARIRFPLDRWDRVSIQLTDPGGKLGTAALAFKIGVDGETFNPVTAGAVAFTSTTSTHWEPGIDVEDAAWGEISITTVEGADESVHFTVFAYNVED